MKQVAYRYNLFTAALSERLAPPSLKTTFL
jgi:hypothetical protein